MARLPDVTGLLLSGKSALRVAAGTASLAAGGWALRALRETPAAQAGPAAIRPSRADRRTTATGCSTTSNPPRPSGSTPRRIGWSSSRCSPATRRAGPESRIPWPIPHRGPRPHCWPSPGWSRHRAGGDRWLPAAHRPGLERTLLAVENRRSPAAAPAAARPRGAAGAGRRRHQPRPLRPSGHGHRPSQPAVPARGLRPPPWVSARTCASGHPRRSGSSNLDWGSSYTIDDLTLTCTPARHFSGRFLSRNNTLWSSWCSPARNAGCTSAGTPATATFADIGIPARLRSI